MAYLAAAVGTIIDMTLHLHVAALITALPTVWVFAERGKRSGR